MAQVKDFTLRDVVSAKLQAGATPEGLCTPWEHADVKYDGVQFLDEWNSDFPHWLIYVIAAVGLGLGLFEAFVGYKYWNRTVFLICGYTCAVITYTLINTYAEEATAPKTEYYAYGFGLLAWIIGGLFFAKFMKFGALVAGAGLGVIYALWLESTVLGFVWKGHPNEATYVMMGVLGLIGALLVYKFERPIVVLSTSYFGSFTFVFSLASLIGNMPSLGDNDWEVLKSEGIECVPNYAWGYASGFILLGIVGAIVQFKVTAKDIDHGKKAAPSTDQSIQKGLMVSEHAPVKYV